MRWPGNRVTQAVASACGSRALGSAGNPQTLQMSTCAGAELGEEQPARHAVRLPDAAARQVPAVCAAAQRLLHAAGRGGVLDAAALQLARAPEGARSHRACMPEKDMRQVAWLVGAVHKQDPNAFLIRLCGGKAACMGASRHALQSLMCMKCLSRSANACASTETEQKPSCHAAYASRLATFHMEMVWSYY